MIVRHKLKVARRCPVDDSRDIYSVTVEANGIVKVEDILAAVSALPEVAFQEAITLALAAKIGCTVTTVGYHSGVETTCVC